VCTFCERHYPGHRTEDDGDDVDLSDDDDNSLVNYRRNRRIFRDLVGMFADGQQDLDGDDSWDGESLDEEDDEEITDNIPWEEEARFRQLGMAHAFDGLAPVFGAAPIIGGVHGMRLPPDLAEDEEGGGIATIEEAGDDAEYDGYESSFIDDDSVGGIERRAREVIELTDSEDGERYTSPLRSFRAGQSWGADDSDGFDDSFLADANAEEDDSVTVQEIARDIGRRLRARAQVVDSDEDEFSSPEVRVAGRRGNARRVTVDSDEPPVRRGAGRS